MAWVSDEVMDQGLDWLTSNGTRVDLCNDEPTTYAEATSTYTLANDTTTTGATADRSPSGRKVTVAAISGGSVTATDTATHWALTDGSSVLCATGELSASTSLTSGNTFNLAAFDIGIPDAA